MLRRVLENLALAALPILSGIAWGWRLGVLVFATELCGYLVGVAGRERR